MKITYVTEALAGGVLTVIANVLNGLIQSGADEMDCTLIYSRRDETPADVQSYFERSIRLIEIPKLSGASEYISFALRLREILKGLESDVIHFHSSRAGFIGRILSILRLLPGHPPRGVYYSPHGFSFMMSSKSPLARRIFYLTEKMLALSGAPIVSCGYDEADLARSLTKNVVCLPNFLHEPFFEHAFTATSQAEQSKYIVTCGRICFQKAPNKFNALAKLLPEFDFLWIGDGELRSLLHEPNIRVTGMVSRDEAVNLLRVGSIYVQCSEWEGLPMAVLEAAALGLPVVLSDIAGHREVANCVGQPTFTNVEDMAGFIKHELSQDHIDLIAKRKRVQRVQNVYSSKVILPKYLSLYGVHG